MKFCLFICLILSLFSCVKNNPDPSWIEIAPWTLVENPDEEGLAGTLSHNFKEAFISINGDVIGYFELPVKLPILKEGNANILVYPVIRNNGIAATKKIYPFCTIYEINANLEKNKTLKINPTTNYLSGLTYWLEDFEDASFDIETNVASTATLVKDNLATILKYGNFYGHVALNSTDSTWIGSSIELTGVPSGGAEVYLEIDYMISNNLLTSLNAFVNESEKPNPNIQLNAFDYEKEGWKKIYIDLKELVSSYSTASYIKHYFTATLDFGKTNTNIYLDNIRLVYKK